MTEDGHHHDAPPNPFLENRRNAAETRVLEERTRKLEELLVSKKLVATDALDRLVDLYENDIGPTNGATVVARAWIDPDYRQRLLKNATAAIRELGFGGMQGEHMVVVENTPAVHNVVVCTLCSCYPRTILGLPPDWYKSRSYRSRVVNEPRAVLREFGTEISDSTAVRVHDSNADMRYLVLPARPEGTDGWSEAQLAELVTRDCMVGVSRAKSPAV